MDVSTGKFYSRENMLKLQDEQNRKFIHFSIGEIVSIKGHHFVIKDIVNDEIHLVSVNKEFGNSEEPPTPRKEKIGRNAKCPCGSGRKYKYCCGI